MWQLAQLPQLASLVLKGNPVCLLPSYRLQLLGALPNLAYLDDQVGHRCNGGVKAKLGSGWLWGPKIACMDDQLGQAPSWQAMVNVCKLQLSYN